MRIGATAFLTCTFLGAAITPGWCPQPASLTAPLGTSCPAAAGNNCSSRPPIVQKPLDLKTMQPQERYRFIGREKAAGRITNSQEMKNFIQTGDAKTTYVPPPPKPVQIKPASMPQATWERIQATRPQSSSRPNSAMDRLQ